jgi:hypothetical protein
VRVSGDSMLPTLRPGERVVLRPVAPELIRPQDVVAFRAPGDRLILHRVHAIDVDRLVTAGDHALLFDPPVSVRDVVGVAQDIGPRLAPRRWPIETGPANVDVWLMGAGPHEAPELPAGWRLHRRPAEGIGVGSEVLAEIRAAVAGKPCVGVSEHAVYAATDVLSAGLPAGTQVLIGCSFGRLRSPLPGHLIPSETAGAHVRVGAPEMRLDAADTLRLFAELVGWTGMASAGTARGGAP